MSLLQIIPTIFYADIETGLNFFTEGLGFKVVYNDNNGFCIVKRDDITIHLSQNATIANIDRPEIRLATDNIEEIYEEIKTKNPQVLHPNLNYIKNQPWGLKEFAALDATKVCVIFQQGYELETNFKLN